MSELNNLGEHLEMPIIIRDKEGERNITANDLHTKYGILVTKVLGGANDFQIESTTPFSVWKENEIELPLSFDNSNVERSKIGVKGISEIVINDEGSLFTGITGVKKDENGNEIDVFDLSIRKSQEEVEGSLQAPDGFFHMCNIFPKFGTIPEGQDLFFPIEMREAFREWRKAGIDIWNNDTNRSAPRLHIGFKDQNSASYLIQAWRSDPFWKQKLIMCIHGLAPTVEICPLDSSIQKNEITYEDIISNTHFQVELIRVLPYISDKSIYKLKELVIEGKQLSLSIKNIGLLRYIPDWQNVGYTYSYGDPGPIQYPKKSDGISFFRIGHTDGALLDIPVNLSELNT